MIIVTGAEGFIGSCLVARLNQDGFNDIVLVDDFGTVNGREKNIEGKKYTQKVERKDFMHWLINNANQTEFVFHIGARTDTTEKDEAVFKLLNLDFSKQLFEICANEGIPLVYASSAATYGDGANGYNDDVKELKKLIPMNPYGNSKHSFDKWVLDQNKKPYFWAGLKFFNVYGPNEYHKARMASVVFHSYHQIKQTGKVKLFRSHREDYNDGEQKRDFIYVKDLCDVFMYLLNNRKHSGLYNLGTGQARTWNDLTKAIFKALNLEPNIEYVDIPEDIRNTYQYFTEANMKKLHDIGYDNAFTSIENAVADYVKNYLETGDYI